MRIIVCGSRQMKYIHTHLQVVLLDFHSMNLMRIRLFLEQRLMHSCFVYACGLNFMCRLQIVREMIRCFATFT